MPKRNINITGEEGFSGFSSSASKPSISSSTSPSSSASPSPEPEEVTSTYRVINQMVTDGVIAQAFNPTTVYEILCEHGLEDKYETLERLENEVSR